MQRIPAYLFILWVLRRKECIHHLSSYFFISFLGIPPVANLHREFFDLVFCLGDCREWQRVNEWFLSLPAWEASCESGQNRAANALHHSQRRQSKKTMTKVAFWKEVFIEIGFLGDPAHSIGSGNSSAAHFSSLLDLLGLPHHSAVLRIGDLDHLQGAH